MNSITMFKKNLLLNANEITGGLMQRKSSCKTFVTIPSKQMVKAVALKGNVKCILTDMAISEYYGSSDCDIVKNQTGPYLLSSLNNPIDRQAMGVSSDGRIFKFAKLDKSGDMSSLKNGVRPVIFSSKIKELMSLDKNGSIVYGGEFPMFVENNDFNINCLKRTGKRYRTLYDIEEYEVNGEKYVIKSLLYNDWTHQNPKLSDGNIHYGSAIFKISKIPWIVDIKHSALISKYVLYGKRWLNNSKDEYNGPFESSTLYNDLNGDFIHDIMPSNSNNLDDLFPFLNSGNDKVLKKI